jgi:hypothetical protein
MDLDVADANRLTERTVAGGILSGSTDADPFGEVASSRPWLSRTTTSPGPRSSM